MCHSREMSVPLYLDSPASNDQEYLISLSNPTGADNPFRNRAEKSYVVKCVVHGSERTDQASKALPIVVSGYGLARTWPPGPDNG